MQWRRLNSQVAPMGYVLSPPDKLWVKVLVAPFIGYPKVGLLFFLHHTLVFSSRNILAGCFFMRYALNLLGLELLFRAHAFSFTLFSIMAVSIISFTAWLIFSSISLPMV